MVFLFWFTPSFACSFHHTYSIYVPYLLSQRVLLVVPPPLLEPWILRSTSPVGNPQLIQFSREVIDLLKNQPSCIMPVSKFIPTYHHHFAKQCRVSDYGCSKLMELLEAVPHVLQVSSVSILLKCMFPWVPSVSSHKRLALTAVKILILTLRAVCQDNSGEEEFSGAFHSLQGCCRPPL